MRPEQSPMPTSLAAAIRLHPKCKAHLRAVVSALPTTLLCWTAAVHPTAGSELAFRTEANRIVELSFHANGSYADPFNEVVLDLTVIDSRGRELRVPGFWAGGDLWKVRYASPVVGTHRFRCECSVKQDRGLHGVTGRIEVLPYTGHNPLHAHGPLQVAASKRYLEHADHTPFFWLGDTWWMGLSHRLRWPEEFQQLAADRKEKGFNVIQIVAGLYPDMPAFDPRGANEAGFPWTTNYSRIRPEYFDAADQRLGYLVEQGFTPCIVGAWGYFMPWMGVDKLKAHWRYLIARYGAWPVVWCAAGEANLPWYLAKGFPYDDRRQVRDWTAVMRFVRETDAFHRPLTVHPTAINYYTARHATDDPSLLDFDMLQTPHGQSEAVPIAVNAVRQSYAAAPVMPVIDGEASYEMLSDSLPTEWTRRMFWLCLMNGAAGHTYGANGIWQCNRPGDPHGKSPHGGTYGKITWSEAMRLPGSRQVGLGKKLLEQYPWQQFRPHPEWVAFAGDSALSFEGCKWLWFPEGNPAQGAPVAKRYFRRVFVLPEGSTPTQARLRVSADDVFSARLNGKTLGTGEDWHIGKQFNLAGLLKPGTNVVAIVAENKPAPVAANPAGLIACLEVTSAENRPILKLVSDETWQCAQREAEGWDSADFDGNAWDKAMVVGRYGDAPWGQIGEATDEAYGPQATGIPGVVRVIYVPRSAAVEVRHLVAQATYTATCFDPVSGDKTTLGKIRADAAGRWICQPPAAKDHDWVIVLGKDEGRMMNDEGRRRTLSNEQVAWGFDWGNAQLHSRWFENKVSGHLFSLGGGQEIALTFSAAVDRVAQPVMRVADFEVRGSRMAGPQHAVFDLRSPTLAVEVALHYELDGPTRRKWAVVTNRTGNELLLLDVELDDLTTDGATAGGGQGQPVFLEDEAFAAIEHPAGMNTGEKGRIQLAHYPGRRLAPDATYSSHVALLSLAKPAQARQAFTAYIQSKSLRPKRALSIYTPFGINNQWGACPALDDEQTLDVLTRLEEWQKKGVRFDYFTLDTGWVDPNSDLTRFRPTCFPNGPGRIVERVNALGMKFGLWFATSWAAESCWDYPPALAGQPPIAMPYRLGYPDKAHEGRMLCFASEPYFKTLRNAVLYHVNQTKVRLLKFDGGSYSCDSTAHGHLPGKYSVEPMFANLIDIANSARAAAPDVFIMWYWGLRSPFWALHGDLIFESGLQMEGSGTSIFPTLYYRDSVTLAQDQNAEFATAIPPVVKDSLGVWLADTRWGNFMGKERWREALVMDLGRGNLFVPNLWGNLYHLSDADVAFLARMSQLAKQNESLFLHRRNILGDPMRDEVYGYANCQGSRGFLFLNNAHFAARRAELMLDRSIGLAAKPGASLQVVSHFPEPTRLLRPDGAGFKAGDVLSVWLRPFEVLMLEVGPSVREVSAARLPARSVARDQAAALGTPLTLKPVAVDSELQMRFADAASFEQQGLKKRAYAFETTLPVLDGPSPTLAVAIRLRRGEAEWRHAPTVVQIAQALARIGGQNIQLIPVPDGRQFGNTQAAGCSWVVYKVRLNREWKHKPLRLAVHAHLPDGVEAQVEAWLVKQWWQDGARPTGDGYYNDAPS
jgi:hypothetical protein